MKNSIKILCVAIVLTGGYFLLRPGGAKTLPATPAPRDVASRSVKVPKMKKASAEFLKAEEGYMKQLEQNPPEIHRVYDNGKMVEDLQVAASENQRQHSVKIEILRDVNDGQEPEPTEEERQMFAEMMAAQGLKSVYSAE